MDAADCGRSEAMGLGMRLHLWSVQMSIVLDDDFQVTSIMDDSELPDDPLGQLINAIAVLRNPVARFVATLELAHGLIGVGKDKVDLGELLSEVNAYLEARDWENSQQTFVLERDILLLSQSSRLPAPCG